MEREDTDIDMEKKTDVRMIDFPRKLILLWRLTIEEGIKYTNKIEMLNLIFF